MLSVNAVDLARRFVDVRERRGTLDNPYITAWLEDAGFRESHDEVPWCGAFVRFIFGRLLAKPIPSLPSRARSWLLVGKPVPLEAAEPGDVVVFARGGGSQPTAEVLDAPGHVAIFISASPVGYVRVIGGNQHNQVREQVFDAEQVLGVRRLE